jgi:hypothetical protein
MTFPHKSGDKLPDVRLGSMGGNSVALHDLLGRKSLIYVWASWCGCREKLPLLEAFHRQHPDTATVSIACDAQGVDLPMRYLAAAKSTHGMWIDATCVLSRRWGLKELPLLLLLDEEGCLAWTGKLDEASLSEIEKLLPKPAARRDVPYPKVDTKNTRIEFLVQLCTNYLTRRRTEDACGFLRQALAVDPENRIIPKQVWAIQHPEKFYSGPIDKDWQAKQPPVTPLKS